MFSCQETYITWKTKQRFLSRMHIFYINVQQPSVVNICKDKNKNEKEKQSADSIYLLTRTHQPP